MIDRSAITGVVLAGGESRRFGSENKLLATVDGRPILTRAVRAVANATDDEPILCLATESDWEDLRHAVGGTSPRLCTDSPGTEGPVAAVTAAARTADTKWVLCVGGDMPTIQQSAIERLRIVAAEVDSGKSRPDAVVPVVDGQTQPLHALYRTGSLREVLDDTPRPTTLRGVLSELAATADVTGSDSLRRSVVNVNTKADLRRVTTRTTGHRRVR
jgi:molybdopterin-guanine dinucleotide biosynthesis protein A